MSKRTPLNFDEQDLTQNLQSSNKPVLGSGSNAFFSSSSPKTGNQEVEVKEQLKKGEKAVRRDKRLNSSLGVDRRESVKERGKSDDLRTYVTTSSRHDVSTFKDELKNWRKTIENTEVKNSSLRLSSGEIESVEDLVRTLKRDYKIKTSMNELSRLGLIFLTRDFETNKKDSIIVKVKES